MMDGSQAKATKEKSKAKSPAKKRAAKSAKKSHDIKKLYDLGTAFWASGTLIAAIKLGLFTKLESGALTADAIARRLGANRRWTEKLVIACAALGLLEKEDSHYRNSPTASHFLVEGKPYYQGEFFTHLGNLWQRFGTLDHTVKTGQRFQNESENPSERADAGGSRAWIMSSHNIAMSGQAEALARALDLKGRKHLCDVGGGPGTYAAVLCLRNPGLRATVLDDPEIVPVAKELLNRSGLTDRVTVKPAQILYDSYGDNYDVMLLSGVLHGLTEANCKKMLRKAYNSLATGGILVVQEMLLDAEEAKPLMPALFSLNMTLGASYSAEEIMAWLYSTGFVKAQVKEIEGAPWMDSIIIAKKV
jgi:predicted O-methyltransferase YrrM